MIDRVGEAWEFEDGMIMLVVKSRARKGQVCEVELTEHDVLVLVECQEYDDYMPAGTFSDSWYESENVTWDRCQSNRWRIA